MVVAPVKVEIFSSPSCDRCRNVLAVLKTVARELGPKHIEWREVNVLDELDYAVELGVLSMPAIAIDGELVFGSHPSAGEFREALESRLKAHDGARRSNE